MFADFDFSDGLNFIFKENHILIEEGNSSGKIVIVKG